MLSSRKRLKSTKKLPFNFTLRIACTERGKPEGKKSLKEAGLHGQIYRLRLEVKKLNFFSPRFWEDKKM